MCPSLDTPCTSAVSLTETLLVYNKGVTGSECLNGGRLKFVETSSVLLVDTLNWGCLIVIQSLL